MVLLDTANLTKASGLCKGPFYNDSKIENRNNVTLRKIFFNLCKGCQLEIMASIPPSAFSARRIRETQHNMKLSNTNKGNESKKFFAETFLELSPLKYNSKLMNSIWGLYNRYSPHNVKKVNDALIHTAELQQSAANSNTKTEPMISLPSTKLDNVWATINITPSH
ncbi:unnamed protein product [Arctia plantaginis]|uniref:Uncharacterized protein n=1 Tax=Arctia plantaginis TaxID=874455 RepID=A0A8S1ATL5_ARCPL|nr:unnamed protein product [Arctia plantaginis]CAB3253386.1 unnamed protein product [Arctia plantaginis]